MEELKFKTSTIQDMVKSVFCYEDINNMEPSLDAHYKILKEIDNAIITIGHMKLLLIIKKYFDNLDEIVIIK
jgi:hypothetical protein